MSTRELAEPPPVGVQAERPDVAGEPILKLRGIYKNFGAVQALSNVNLDVPAGKVTALVGDNGAGKSVLIKCVAGIHTAERGQILWEGRPISIRNPRDAASLGIETVYQDLALCDNLDIVQNMFLGRESTSHFLLNEDKMEKAAAETLAGLAVTSVRSIRQPVASLSGGQRQSVAVAKAVMWNSKLVIMDEPTAALGVVQTRMVLDLIKRLADRGLAVIVISHNLNDVFEVADRLAVLYLGGMVAEGPASEFDRQSVVELMTTGASRRSVEGSADERGGAVLSGGAEADPRSSGEQVQAMSEAEEPIGGVRAAAPDRQPVGSSGLAEHLTEPAAAEAALAVAPEIVANTLGEYFGAWWIRLRAGETGVLPVIVGLALIGIIFQTQNSSFLSAGNLVNLMVQSSTFVLLGMAESFALLLGEIDLSIGFGAGLGGVVAAELVKAQTGWPWWAAVIVALLCTAAFGAFQGTLITRLGLPSFVVTLGGLLGLQGLMLLVLGNGGTLPISDSVIDDFANGKLTVAAGWIILAVLAAGYALLTGWRDRRRRRSGLVAPPASLTALKIATVTAFGVVVVVICSINRGNLTPIRGVPWVAFIVLGVLGLWSLLLGRTRFGRDMYAVGGNPEAARRAGVNLALIRTLAFALAGFTAGIGGVIYASRLYGVSTTFDGGQLVLYAVAAAVIGGTSLFGGRGKPLHAVLGGIIIGAIYNGMGLLGLSASIQYIVTALVLVAAVTVDALTRRGRVSR